MADVPKIPKHSSLRWVRISDLQCDPDAQRDPAIAKRWAARMAKDFDPDQLGYILVSHRADGNYYVVDGWHRVELLRAVGWGDQRMEAEVFEGASQAEDAQRFIGRNNRTSVRPLDKFRVRVTGNDPVACDIDRIVRSQGLCIGAQKVSGSVRAVAALEKIYRGGGVTGHSPKQLARTLSILLKAWGDASANFDGAVIEGIGLVCLRYGADLDGDALAVKLSKHSGGAPGLLGQARSWKDIRSRPVAHCVAAICVDLYNKARRGGKLEDWWNER